MRLHLPLLLFILSLCSCYTSPNHSFWVVTDIHVSDDYKPGTEPPPFFCTKGKGPAGPMGYYNCDSPRSLILNALGFMQTLPTEDFLFFLGDSPTYYGEHPKTPLGKMTKEHIVANVKNIAGLLADSFPGKRVFPTLGNHDCYPVSYLAVPGYEQSTEWLGMLADTWSHFGLPDSALATVRYAGYYTAPVHPGLRVISLNTIYFSADNPFAMLNQSDHGQQFAWMRRTLEQARKAGERVIIIGHIGPGSMDLGPLFTWTKYSWTMYRDILADHHDIIVGQLFGHMHFDTFHVVHHPKDKTPIGVCTIVPALTPRASANNPLAPITPGKQPALRMYHYDPKTFEFLDFDQYYANISQASERHPPGLTWQREYSAKHYYDLQSLRPAEVFARIASQLDKNDFVWERFRAALFVTRDFPCEGDCRKFVSCSAQHADFDDFLECAK